MEERKVFGINTFILKVIAIVSMTIDHVGYVLLPQYPILRVIGRLAFPIYCFLIIEGYFHTKDIRKYLLRLLIFALVSEVPFDLAFNIGNEGINPFHNQNVFFTLFLGLVVVYIYDNLKKYAIDKFYLYIPAFVGIFGCIILAHFTNTDYEAGGVCLIFTLYVFREYKLLRILIASLELYLFFGVIECFGIIAFLPIALYNGKLGPKMKYFFYIYYPTHLLILFFLKNFL